MVQTIHAFSKLKVLIVGDLILDKYLLGSVERISPEAPVPIVAVNKKEDRLGGAGNVALNIKGLGATPFLCTLIGKDKEATTLSKLMEQNHISTQAVIQSASRITSAKTRILAKNQQMIRFDVETTEYLNKEQEDKLIEKMLEIIENQHIDVLILQDYNKGVLTKKVIQTIIEECNKKNIPSAVDPKENNFFEYKNVTLFKPNLREIKQGLNQQIDQNNMQSLQKAVEKLKNNINNKFTLITLSDKGVFISDGKKQHLIPAQLRNVADVSGAGDTVISIAALSLGLKLDMTLMAKLANIAGGLVCQTPGVVPIDKEQFIEEMSKMS